MLGTETIEGPAENSFYLYGFLNVNYGYLNFNYILPSSMKQISRVNRIKVSTNTSARMNWVFIELTAFGFREAPFMKALPMRP